MKDSPKRIDLYLRCIFYGLIYSAHYLSCLFKDDAGELLDIAADGVIDFGESKLFNEILQKLDAIVRAALTVKYAEGGYPINDRK